MDWYYAHGGERIGPLDDAGFRARVANGTIGSDTYVWQPGMPDWKRYGHLADGAPSTDPLEAPQPATGATVMCAESGQLFPLNEAIAFAGAYVGLPYAHRFFQRVLQDGLSRASIPVVGLWPRFGARALDTFLLYSVFAPVFFLGLYLSLLNEEAVAALAVATMFLGSLLGFAVSLFYYIYFVGRFGGTPGKLALGYAIVRGDGSRISMPRATGRYFAEWVTLLTFGVGYLMIAFTGERTALHDLIADTRVVRRNEAP